MTLEELKAEAKRQGYNLIKIPPKMPKLKKCPICGRLPKVRQELVRNLVYVSCPGRKCLIGPVVNRRDGVKVISKREGECEAREAWNEMVSKGGDKNG